MTQQIRTDLAKESSEAAGSIPGVKVASWEESGVEITEVIVETESAAQQLNKDVGRYLTLECEGVRSRDPLSTEALSGILGEELLRLLPPDEVGAPVMVVGLGNRSITPDSLGPMTVEGVLVTRHLINEMPEQVDGRLNSVCAIAPGVLGVTGIETMESILSLVRSIHPRCVIAIDSLAARASRRVGVSIQLSDTGIRPGSGVGNHRRALTEEALGVKVIAIGMPTVVYASTIARDALSFLSEGSADPAVLDEMIQKLFESEIGEMIVTPREVDDMIRDAARIISTGINLALQDQLSPAELEGLVGK